MAEKGNLRLQRAVWQCTQPVEITLNGQLQHTPEVRTYIPGGIKQAPSAT